MSKAEDRALWAYPVLFSERNGYDNTFKDRRESYIKGYHQAEKALLDNIWHSPDEEPEIDRKIIWES